MTEDLRQLHSQLETLRRSYAEQLPARISGIGARWQRLQQGFDLPLAQELIRELHGLAGSGASFGYPAVSDAARELETILRPMASADHTPELGDSERVPRLLERLESAAWTQVKPASEPPAVAAQPRRQRQRSGASLRVCLVENDAALASHYRRQLESFGMEVDVHHRLDDLGEAVRGTPPDVVVMDIMFPEGESAGIVAVQGLRLEPVPLPPIVFLSARRDLRARLDAVAVGGAAYVVKPVDGADLTAVLHRLTSEDDSAPGRILIVDDDVDAAQQTALHLRRAGMQTRILTSLDEILLELRAFRPELLLLELYLPEANGIELAAVLRQEEEVANTAIVFHSSETNVDRHLDAMIAGGDDFLVKPVPPRQLIAAVRARLKRTRAIRNLITRDPTTGLLDHSNLMGHLNEALAGCRQRGQCLTYAALGIEGIDEINQRYGYAAGDRVLATVAHLFRGLLGKHDVSGRCGGAKFGVILPGMALDEAVAVLERLRKAFAQVILRDSGQTFMATLHVGAAAAAPMASHHALHRAAAAALDAARQGGSGLVAVESSQEALTA
jgi:diguanylate cyclase (GGDEF)-like protein